VTEKNLTYAHTAENEEYVYPLAQIHAKYSALRKLSSNESSADEVTALKTLLGLSSLKTEMKYRFSKGYFEVVDAANNGKYSDEGTYTECYTSGEPVGDGSPDAMGFVTWWIDGAGAGNSQFREAIVDNFNATDDCNIDQKTLRMVGGFSYNPADKQNFTYAVLDIFSMQ
jgi:hypothetical protein